MPVTDPTVADWLEVLWRRRRLGLLAGLLGGALTWAYLARIEPLYEAEAVLVLDRGLKTEGLETKGQDIDPFRGGYEKDIVATERDLLMARDSFQQAYQTAGLSQNPAYAGSRDPATSLAKRTVAAPGRDGWNLSIKLRDEDPRRAERALTALIGAYQADQARRALDRNRQQIARLEAQAKESDRRVRLARGAERDLAEANGVITQDITDQNPLLVRLRDLNAERVRLEPLLTSTETAGRLIEAADALTEPVRRVQALLDVPEIGSDGAVFNSRDRLAQAEADAARLLERYREKHPKMIEAQARVAGEREQLRIAIERSRAATLSERDRRRDQHRQLSQAIADEEKRLARYRDALVKLRTLSDETRAAEDVHQRVLSSLRDEQVRQNLHRPQLAVSQPPASNGLVVNGSASVFAAISLFAGIVAGVGLPLIAELLSRRVRGADAIARLTGLTVLGSLPADPAADSPTPGSGFAEGIRALRAALALARPSGHSCGYVVVVTSAGANEGKTTISRHLASSFAASGARVLVVEADLRRPRLAERLAVAVAADGVAIPGLTQLLAGVDGVAPVPTAVPNLDLVVAGGTPGNAGELLNSHCLPEWLAEIRQVYDWIILDAPPVGLVADAVVLLAASDGLLMVVRDDRTDRNLLTAALQRLEPLRPRIVGAALNAVPGSGGTYPY